MENSKAIVIDGDVLGYEMPTRPEWAGVLEVKPGSPVSRMDGMINLHGRKVRPATQEDFDRFRVSSEGYALATDMRVANTIAEQIGGRAFFMMGTQYKTGDARSLTFNIRGCKKISHVIVSLNDRDTYTLEFIKCRGTQRQAVDTREDVYFDSLREIISRVTGLALSL